MGDGPASDGQGVVIVMGTASRRRRSGGRHAAGTGSVPAATVLSPDGRQAAPAQRAGWSRKAQFGGLAAGVLVVGGLLGAGIPTRLGEAPHGPKHASSHTAPQAGGAAVGTMRTIAPVDRATASSHARHRADPDARPRETRSTTATKHPAHHRAESPGSAAATRRSGHTRAGEPAETTGPPASHAQHTSRGTRSQPRHTPAHPRSGAPTSHSAVGEQPRPLSRSESAAKQHARQPAESSRPAPTSTPTPTPDGTGSPPVTVESPPGHTCVVNVLGLGLICH
jgi:hypothetical protein